MAIYEIGPELLDSQAVHNGITISMKADIYPTNFQPGIIQRVGEVALAGDQEDFDLIHETFGPLEV